MKKLFANLALQSVQHPVQLLPPNNRSYERYGDLIVERCIEIIKTSENLDEARSKIEKEFEQEAKNDLH